MAKLFKVHILPDPDGDPVEVHIDHDSIARVDYVGDVDNPAPPEEVVIRSAVHMPYGTPESGMRVVESVDEIIGGTPSPAAVKKLEESKKARAEAKKAAEAAAKEAAAAAAE